MAGQFAADNRRQKSSSFILKDAKTLEQTHGDVAAAAARIVATGH